MRWFELTFLLIAGALFFYVGWEIWKKKKISLIHEYHHKNVCIRGGKNYFLQNPCRRIHWYATPSHKR